MKRHRKSVAWVRWDVLATSIAVMALSAVVCQAAEPKTPPAVANPDLLPKRVLNMPEAAEGDGIEMPTFGFDAAFNNKYLWRGLLLTDGPVLQPSATVAWYRFSFNIWGNLDLDDANNMSGEFNEVDYTIDYSTEVFGPLDGSVGFIVYDFPNTPFATTTEFYVGLGLDVPLSPSLTAYFDIDEVDGIYLNGSIGHSVELPEVIESVSASLDLGLNVGWGNDKHNTAYYGSNTSGFTDMGISASLPITIGEHVTVAPSLTYTTILNDDLRGAVANDDNVVYGVTISISF